MDGQNKSNPRMRIWLAVAVVAALAVAILIGFGLLVYASMKDNAPT